MDLQESKIKVVMIPWLAHGHVSPFLELAKRLTKRNFHIYFCSTPIILNSIKKTINDQELSLSIQLIEFHLPSMPNLPPHHHTTNGLPSHLMPSLKDALDLASPNFSTILETLKPNLVIYDHNQPWAPTMASSHNIKAVEFLTTGASMIAFVLHMIKDHTLPFPYPEVLPRSYESYLSRGHETSVDDKMKEGYRFMESIKRCDFILIKSFRELEGKYIDYISSIVEKKVVTVGPLVVEDLRNDSDESIEIMKWLDKKDEASTVFLSFGSECFLTKDEMTEIAHGLDQLSDINFIWVIRFPVGEKIKVAEALPEGFVERVGERGKIVEDWAPQMKILGHSSIGGFVSHCGWSSVMESLKSKVPIIAMPMHLDQPFNGRLVEEIGAGVGVGRDEKGGLKGEEIAKAIRKVLVEKDGEDVRKKARELGDIMRFKDEEEIDGVEEELWRLCKEGK